MDQKRLEFIVIGINFVGIICLIYFAIPYIIHNTVVQNPDSMLPAEAWDNAGMALTIGLLPLIIANLFGYIFIIPQKKLLRLLWFIPSILCLIVVISYWCYT
ncbi:MAG: hypothetical protein Q4D45_03605 [Lachnospiraceae bacterium]|nr:hypothetical protein [Lachnospiraceae bacterium]